MKNYYETLGVQRNATPDEIKRAYRKLASQHHPDKGGDKNKFQEIEAAYRTLSDPQSRAQHDNPNQFSGFGQQNSPFDMDAIFSMFGARFQHAHQQTRRAQMSLWVTLEDIALGGPKTVSVGTHQGTHAIEIEIPRGINDGDTVQYGGIGPQGMDLIITYRIHPNPRWQRNGQTLITEQTISVWDLILGCEKTLRDILGNELQFTVPPRTQPGTVLRLRGRGLTDRNGQVGDLLIKVQGELPNTISDELIELIRQNNIQ
jgi:DnaJ-class molecular chaperone